ncbi:hypothetical protein D3C87_1814020 [compost metagenome]
MRNMFMLAALALSSRSRTTAGVARLGMASAGIQLAPIMVMSRPLMRHLKEWSISSFSTTHCRARRPILRVVTSPSRLVVSS